MRYDTEDENGETRRDRNERFGVPPGPDPEIPPVGEHVWQWFCDLSACRGHTESGPQPISHQEIQAWSQLTGVEILPEEVSMLREMDEAYMRESAKERQAAMEAHQQRTQPKKKPKPLSS